jgi:hypothetical protein
VTRGTVNGPWYRNVSGRYHCGAADWVVSGKAICGANVARPDYMIDHGPPPLGHKARTCKTCLRLAKGR